ncbi:hypothetical protein GCM10009730_63500 [Streptomyces albidochromogenes]|uniref:histidine kinase dimerization/phospho-acceptor domain-containing protein n=1 Tax=Streptomyces albidochromogenes TaxID=329524 RepID=UPI001ABF90A2|nr:histidine kinase dimerization/phospho-acceptor domain-containing protein [Streptomyces albidochromogenes]
MGWAPPSSSAAQAPGHSRSSFFANVSHEFRTPLTLLLGPLQQALADEDRPERREQLELAERGALRLLTVAAGAAESLGHCLVRGYVHGTNAIVIGEPAEPPVGTRTPHVAVMSLHDFQAIVTAAAHYWEEVQRDARLNTLNR